MPDNSKVKLDLHVLSNEQLAAKAQSIKQAMTGNVNFPTPDPALSAVGGLADQLLSEKAAADAADAVSQSATAAMNTTRGVLISTITSLGAYVQKTSLGNAAKIKSADMGVEKDREPAQLPAAPATLSVTAGQNEGELACKWPTDKTADFYELECATAVTGPFTHAEAGTKAKATIKNLASGTIYYIRARTCNAAGKGPWSDTVSRRAP